MKEHVLNSDLMLPLFVANGVLGVRDLGVHNIDEILLWRKQAKEGKIVSPRIVTAGKVLDGYPQADASFSILVKTPEEGRKAVRDLKVNGVDCIKVYDVLARDTYYAIADESKKAGLPFVGHAVDEDYKIFVIDDLCADGDQELHASLMRFYARRGTVISSSEFSEGLK